MWRMWKRKNGGGGGGVYVCVWGGGCSGVWDLNRREI